MVLQPELSIRRKTVKQPSFILTSNYSIPSHLSAAHFPLFGFKIVISFGTTGKFSGTGPSEAQFKWERRGTIKCGFLRLYANKLRAGAFAARDELPYHGSCC